MEKRRRNRWLAGTLVGAMFAIGIAGASAQDATPTSVGCTVAPHTQAEVDALIATPATGATPVAENIAALFADGTPAEEALVEEVTEVVDMANACVAAGDLLRFLALTTDRFIVEDALAVEATPIIQGSPSMETPNAATPTGMPGLPTGQVNEVRVLPDGRVIATVGEGQTAQYVLLVERDGNYLIDRMVPMGNAVTWPPEADMAVAAALGMAMNDLGPDAAVVLVSAVDWTDSALGCPEPGRMYAQVITPGYKIVISAAGTTATYHSDRSDRVVRCDA